MNINKVTQVSKVLRNQVAMNVLFDLIEGQKSSIDFRSKYGRLIWHPLKALHKANLIKKDYHVIKRKDAFVPKKHYHATVQPAMYSITDYGRWIAHSCIIVDKHFMKS